jgi:predicted nucleic acid-binding protein
MSDRFFLDTNVFVYSLDRNAVATWRREMQLIKTALKTQKGITSYQVVQVVAAAAQAQCQVLMTEDLQHGQQFGDLRIENPFLSPAS